VVVRAPADGHTLLQLGSSHAVNATLYDKLDFDLGRDIVPVAALARAHLVMLVNPAVSARTVPEFTAYAKANPRRITMASAGSGSAPSLAGELFQMMTGTELIHVPYRGGAPAVADLIAGQVQVMFSNLPAAEYIRAGKLRALAVTTAARSDELPDVPTVAEFVPGYEASAWYGIGAPRTTPAEIVGLLNREINAVLADGRSRARLAEFGATVLMGPPADFARLIAEETEKWGRVVKFAGIRAD
jgi:tripartite-type tricarboxylate transporter receptor subunit TctC